MEIDGSSPDLVYNDDGLLYRLEQLLSILGALGLGEQRLSRAQEQKLFARGQVLFLGQAVLRAMIQKNVSVEKDRIHFFLLPIYASL